MVFMCIVWFLQPKPTVSQTLTDWYLQTSRSSFCPLRTEFLHIIYTNFSTQGRTMAQVVCRRPLKAKVRIRSQISPCEIYGGHSGTGTGFSPSASIFPCHYHFTNIPYSSTCGSYRKDKRAKPGNLPKKQCSSEIGEDCNGRQFHFFSLQGVNTWVSKPRPMGRICELCIYYKSYTVI
jgi:hypothetical protein